MPRAVRHSSAGFTLIELMVVLTIIAIAATVSVPVIQQAQWDRQLHQQAVNFMNVFREARSRAAFRFAAQLVRVDLTGGVPVQTITEGTSSACTLSTFPAIQLISTNTYLQQNTDVSVSNISPAAPYLEICYTPLGHLFYRYDSVSPFTDDNGLGIGRPLNGGFEYSFINVTYPGTTARRVILTLDGSARMAL